MSNNYSPLNAKGTVEIIATDAATGEVLQSQVVTNTIVRDGRVALAKLITGEASMDKSYLVLDTTFPLVYGVSTDLQYGWMGITNAGIDCLYHIGPEFSADPVANAGIAAVTRDIYGFVTYLNQQFNAYSQNTTNRDIPIYNYAGDIVRTVPHTSPPLVASVVDVVGPRVMISARNGGTGSIVPYSTSVGVSETVCVEIPGHGVVCTAPPQMEVQFQTDDDLFGPGTIMHTAQGATTAESDYIVNGLQLGVSNGTTNITDSEFVAGTYVSPRYTPTISYGQADADALYDTQAKFEVVIPAAEGNGESGLGVTYTEAALLCRNDRWFTHAHFGQFFKSNQIQLTIRWTVDFMP